MSRACCTKGVFKHNINSNPHHLSAGNLWCCCKTTGKIRKYVFIKI